TAHLHTSSTVLSGLPSQSLSIDDEQSRGSGSMLPMQVPQTLSLQVEVPVLQTPTEACPQSCVSPSTHGHPSLGVPSQVSSLPGSQVSSAAGTMLQSPQVPSFPQVWVPVAQVPCAPSSEQERFVSGSQSNDDVSSVSSGS